MFSQSFPMRPEIDGFNAHGISSHVGPARHWPRRQVASPEGAYPSSHENAHVPLLSVFAHVTFDAETLTNEYVGADTHGSSSQVCTLVHCPASHVVDDPLR